MTTNHIWFGQVVLCTAILLYNLLLPYVCSVQLPRGVNFLSRMFLCTVALQYRFLLPYVSLYSIVTSWYRLPLPYVSLCSYLAVQTSFYRMFLCTVQLPRGTDFLYRMFPCTVTLQYRLPLPRGCQCKLRDLPLLWIASWDTSDDRALLLLAI